MGERVLMKGNEAVGEAAVLAGCRFFFGYPITPQNELPEYMARRLPEVGGVFLQAESEVAAINMVYGAAAAGVRAMTSSSSPGISLKQEGISYLCACELPCVVVNMMRGGPGLGGIQPAQSDYFQATRGGGHGDYRTLVYGPGSVQELVDLTAEAFAVADRYRNPVVILADGILGQMMEPAVFPEACPPPPAKPWAVTGAAGRQRNLINSLCLDPELLEAHNWKLRDKFCDIEGREVRWEEVDLSDAELVVVAYGTTARVVKAALGAARQEGLKVGMLRPITLWPFPFEPLKRLCGRARAVLAVEMSAGQMVEDVRLAVEGRLPVHFYGRTGGVVPTPREVLQKIRELSREAGGRK